MHLHSTQNLSLNNMHVYACNPSSDLRECYEPHFAKSKGLVRELSKSVEPRSSKSQFTP